MNIVKSLLEFIQKETSIALVQNVPVRFGNKEMELIHISFKFFYEVSIFLH